MVEAPGNVLFQEWGGRALDFQWKSVRFPDDVSIVGIRAKAVPVEGLEQGREEPRSH